MHNIERFYKHRLKSMKYLERHCLDSQLDEVEDLYHESLLIADRRKDADPTRDDGLCLFSGYSTSLRSGSHSDWHYKNEFLDFENCNNFLKPEDYFIIEDPLDSLIFSDNITKIAEAFALFNIYCSHLRAAVHICLAFYCGEYANMSKIGEDYDLSRERIRQLRNTGVYETFEVLKEFESLSGFGMFFHFPITYISYSESINQIPAHLKFWNLYQAFDCDFILAFYKYLKVISFFLKNPKRDFDFLLDTKYKGKSMSESRTVDKDIFICLPPSPINIYYHDNVKVLEIGWLRELFGRFVQTDKGWYDELLEDDDEVVYYKNVPEIIEDVVGDFISENFELQEYEKMQSYLEENFLKFFDD